MARRDHETAVLHHHQRHRQSGKHRERDQPEPQAQPRRQRPPRQHQEEGGAGEVRGQRHAGDDEPHVGPHAASGRRTSAASPLTTTPAITMCQLPGNTSATPTASTALASATSQSRRPCSCSATSARKTAGKAKSSPQRAGSETSPPSSVPTAMPARNEPKTASTL